MVLRLIFNTNKGDLFMGKILGDLKLTVIAGLVLTVVIYYVAPMIAG